MAKKWSGFQRFLAVVYSVAFDVLADESPSQKSCLTRKRSKFCKKNSQASQQRPKFKLKKWF
jgi:hypothetical protein